MDGPAQQDGLRDRVIAAINNQAETATMKPDSTLRNKLTDAISKVRADAAMQQRVASTNDLVNAAMEHLMEPEPLREEDHRADPSAATDSHDYD